MYVLIYEITHLESVTISADQPGSLLEKLLQLKRIMASTASHGRRAVKTIPHYMMTYQVAVRRTNTTMSMDDQYDG